MKTDDFKIVLDPESWLDDFAWWTMRYCIGRKTYASSSWREILKVIEENRSLFMNNRLRGRLEFFARDIRSEITRQISFIEGITTINDHNSIIISDAYSLLTKSLITEKKRCKNFNFNDYDFHIDCKTGGVTIERRNTQRNESRCFDIFPNPDLMGWVKLANSIDKRYSVTIWNGTDDKLTDICVEVPLVMDWKTQTMDLVWSPVNRFDGVWYAPEYIMSEKFLKNE